MVGGGVMANGGGCVCRQRVVFANGDGCGWWLTMLFSSGG